MSIEKGVLKESVKRRGKQVKEKSILILFRVLFSRTMITILLLLLQVAAYVGIFRWLSAYSSGFYYVFTGLSVICIVYIINCKENPAFKLAWMIPLCLFPVFGAALYIFIKIDPGSWNLTNRLKRRIEETSGFLQTSNRVRQKIEGECSKLIGVSHYIENINGLPTFDRTEVVYFPLGEDKFEDLKIELEKAEKFIFMEYFIIGKGYMWETILEILKRKASEGVEVRIMYDGMNTIVNLPYNYPKRLKEFGIKAKLFSPIKPLLSTRQNNRDHRKILVIDGKVAYTGGINLADEYINEKLRFGHWKDTAIRLKGEAVRSFTKMFLQMWKLDEVGGEDYRKYIYAPIEEAEEEGNGYVIPYNDDPTNGQDIASTVYLDILYKAKKYVHIMTPYLILDNETVVALSTAAKRGIEVIIMMPHIPDKKYAFYIARTYYMQLIEAGVEIYEYTPGFLHAKSFVSDDDTAVVGSINLDYRSLYEHFECAVYIYKNKVISDIERDFKECLLQCEKITREKYKKFSIITRGLGCVLRLIGPLM